MGESECMGLSRTITRFKRFPVPSNKRRGENDQQNSGEEGENLMKVCLENWSASENAMVAWDVQNQK